MHGFSVSLLPDAENPFVFVEKCGLDARKAESNFKQFVKLNIIVLKNSASYCKMKTA